eukprot:Tamp_22496.p2 GENE.Tamp_22496~~Tamp_22496.p2  ORF type:complete len:154 (+),score=12.41 Tamp_22496:328-789(+)
MLCLIGALPDSSPPPLRTGLASSGCARRLPSVLLQLLRSHKGIAAQMQALRESIEKDFKSNLGVLRACVPALMLALQRRIACGLGPSARLHACVLGSCWAFAVWLRRRRGGRGVSASASDAARVLVGHQRWASRPDTCRPSSPSRHRSWTAPS